MNLKMYIGTDLIETISLDANCISKRGYLGQFKRTLKLKYKKTIMERNDKIDFLVVSKSISDQQESQMSNILVLS